MTELGHVTIERKKGMNRGARDRITEELLGPGHPELRGGRKQNKEHGKLQGLPMSWKHFIAMNENGKSF